MVASSFHKHVIGRQDGRCVLAEKSLVTRNHLRSFEKKKRTAHAMPFYYFVSFHFISFLFLFHSFHFFPFPFYSFHPPFSSSFPSKRRVSSKGNKVCSSLTYSLFFFFFSWLVSSRKMVLENVTASRRHG